MQFTQQAQIYISDENHLRIRSCFRFNTIGWKGEVTRSKDHGLRELYVHIMNVWKVADTSSNGHVAFILNGACLRTMAHPRVPILRIRQKRHKKDIHAFICQQSAELREFRIVTNEDAYFTTIGIKYLELLPSLHAPNLCLIGGYMNFLITLYRPITLT